MINRHLSALVLLLGLSPVVKADPCVTQANTLEMNACARQQLDAADAALNAAYRSLMAALPAENEPGVSGAPPRIALRNAQRLWIKFRDADCAARAQLYAGGTIVTIIHLSCMRQHVEQRTRELQQDQWLPEG